MESRVVKRFTPGSLIIDIKFTLIVEKFLDYLRILNLFNL